jgi:CubicO group peptidase (beta-lactamase class C family)
VHDRSSQQTLSGLDTAVDSGALPGLHAVVALQQGREVLARYYRGPDERMGRPLGVIGFGPDVAHDLRSVTKSIVSLLFGIVASEHRLDLHAPLRDVLVTRSELFGEAARALTLEHAVTMTLGLEWDESISYADPRNAERQMSDAADRVAYLLSRPGLEPPGTRWHYCGGATELLAAVITEVSQSTLHEFATRRLFEPLGLRSVEWIGDEKGPYAASGLRMTPLELARIGQLILQRGAWNGRELVPQTWLRAALAPRVPIEGKLSYGYHFYVADLPTSGGDVHFSAGYGNGGQRLYVLPALEAVVVVSAGNYNDRKLGNKVPSSVLGQHVLPLLAAGDADHVSL